VQVAAPARPALLSRAGSMRMLPASSTQAWMRRGKAFLRSCHTRGEEERRAGACSRTAGYLELLVVLVYKQAHVEGRGSERAVEVLLAQLEHDDKRQLVREHGNFHFLVGLVWLLLVGSSLSTSLKRP
jgi:hypothetical protein